MCLFFKYKFNFFLYYLRAFSNVFDFIYQVYQIGVNNFCINRLFESFALVDLADMLKVKIFVFDIKPSGKQASIACLNGNDIKQIDCNVFQPLTDRIGNSLKINDCIFLSSNNCSKIRYKFLLPKSHQLLLNETLLAPKNSNKFFLRTKLTYSMHMTLLTKADISKCFSFYDLNTNFKVNLFLKFLFESSVHTIIATSDLKFGPLNEPTQMIAFLNDVWGQDHFLLDEILAEIDENKKKQVLLSFLFCLFI